MLWTNRPDVPPLAAESLSLSIYTTGDEDNDGGFY
jgi:hypothetical protein